MLIWISKGNTILLVRLTSRWRSPRSDHAITKNKPCNVKIIIVRCPSQTWYLVACSNGISIIRRRIDPLATGRKRKAKQNIPIEPNRKPTISITKMLQVEIATLLDTNKFKKKKKNIY